MYETCLAKHSLNLCIAIYVSITDNVEVYFSFVLMSVLQFFIFETWLNLTSVILLQIVMVRPWTHFVKNHESHSRIIESQFKKEPVLN